MGRFIFVAVGGAIGALSRYWIAGLTHRMFDQGFPWGTLCVNLMGSLVIGLLWGVSEAIEMSYNMRVFLFLGILGSFTTFSAFSLENFSLLRDGEYGWAALNMFLNVFLGLVLVFSGHWAATRCGTALLQS